MSDVLDELIISHLERYLHGETEAVYVMATATYASWSELNAIELLDEKARLKSLATERYGDRGDPMIEFVMNRWNRFLEDGE